MFQSLGTKGRILAVLAVGMLVGATLFMVPAAHASDCFPDVPTGHWAHDFICWLKTNGIVSGYPDGNYYPEYAVSRAELAVYIKNAYEPGRAKAVVHAQCSGVPSSIFSAENYANGAPITISDGALGQCTIDFGFQVYDRFIVATTRHPTTPLGVTLLSMSGNQATFLVWHGDNGAAAGGPIMVVVY
jgi:hypothetical protein